MSDFIFSTQRQIPGNLKNLLSTIYLNEKPKCFEFHGDWGSLAVFENIYYSWNPYENDRYICAMIGGPILKFNRTVKHPDLPDANTKLLLKKWKIENNINWDSDLSGPFCAVCIDKENKTAEFVTDLFSFVPVFHSTQKNSLSNAHVVGTHNDTVAALCDRIDDIDPVSAADLLINTNIVFPYTLHKEVRQLHPGSISKVESGNSLKQKIYWLPHTDHLKFKNIDEAASVLRESFESSIKSIVSDTKNIATFLSGGEDSRVVLAAIPENIKKESFIFLDCMNREGKIAQKVADIHQTKFNIETRCNDFYPDNLDEVSNLLGSQYNFTQVHTFGFHKKLKNYDAILGGWFADSLLKSMLAPTKKIQIGKHKFYEFLSGEEKPTNFIFSNHFFIKSEIKEELKLRYLQHENKVRDISPDHLEEWRTWWPVTNKEYSANVVSARKLFRSYEPMLDEAIIKIAVSAPVEWKINRKLFHKAFKDLLSLTKFVTHGENGHFPYFGSIINIPLKVLISLKRKIANINSGSQNQGPWSRWNDVGNNEIVNQRLAGLSNNINDLQEIFKFENPDEIISKKWLNPYQRLIMLRLLHNLNTSKLVRQELLQNKSIKYDI